ACASFRSMTDNAVSAAVRMAVILVSWLRKSCRFNGLCVYSSNRLMMCWSIIILLNETTITSTAYAGQHMQCKHSLKFIISLTGGCLPQQWTCHGDAQTDHHFWITA